MTLQRVTFGFLLALIVGTSARGFGQYEYGTPYCIWRSFSEPADVIYLVNYLYGGGPAPEPVAFAGNIDCEGSIDLVDVVYLVNYVYRGGPSPCGFCGYYRDPTDPEDGRAIAMFVGNGAYASETLVSRVQTDLERLRTQGNAEQTPLSSLHFAIPWPEGQLVLAVDSATYDAVGKGAYHAWDSLNEAGRLIDFRLGFYCSSTCHYFVHLLFERLANCRLLGEKYESLPGVLASMPELLLCQESCPWTSIYPMARGDTVRYVFEFRRYYLAGESYKRYYYFAMLPDSAWIVGEWELKGDEDPFTHPNAPEWWPQARENIEWYDEW